MVVSCCNTAIKCVLVVMSNKALSVKGIFIEMSCEGGVLV